MAKRTTKRPKSLAEQIIAVVEEREITGYRLSQMSGINQSIIARFLNGTRGVSLDNASAICDALGLELRARR